MIQIEFDKRKIEQLADTLKKTGGDLKKDIAIAINATAKKGKSLASKEVREEITAPKKAVDQTIDVTRKASAGQLGGTVRLKKTRRIPLRDFKAKQNKQGVSYKISKKGGRGFVRSAFQGPTPQKRHPKWNGRVFKRVGKQRLPIVQLLGVSPWGVYKKKRKEPKTQSELTEELRKQIDRRIRFRILKAQGVIKGK